MVTSRITLFIISLLHIWLILAADHCDDNFPISKTKYGDVRGTVMKSRKGKPFAAFRGIPYAKPPVGSLRFKSPEEPDKWNHVRDATKDARVCIQQDYLFKMNPTVEGSEDCLYINVYSPRPLCSAKKNGKLLPVAVLIHHGAFMSGNSRSDIFGPEYLMDYDMVVVTFNYRLGVMGFLSTYDDEAPGNWAFKDQLAALKWVKNNIQFFGGSNKRVTLIGQSAGAGSAHHLMLSPAAKGLFQGVISMSGSALAGWAKPLEDLNLMIANITAVGVGCKDLTDTKKIVACLRNTDASSLVQAANIFRRVYSEPLTPYFPAIEKKSTRNVDPFITEDPFKIILSGNFERVPWILGTTSSEGILRAAPYIRQAKRLEEINHDFDGSFKDRLAYILSFEPSKIDLSWMKAKDFYFKGKDQLDPNDSESIKGLINIYTDRGFTYPMYQTLLLHKLMGHKHIYAYNFNYRGKYSYGDLFALTEKNVNYKWGVSHCDDLLYIFHSPGRFPNYDLPKTDMKISDMLLHLFSNFIQYRDPTPKRIRGDNHIWEEIPDSDSMLSDADLRYLNISGSYELDDFSSSMANGFYLERMNFWKKMPMYENFVFRNTSSSN